MQVTRIRVNGQKPTDIQLKEFSDTLGTLLTDAGFNTEVNLSAGKIGFHMKQFTINTDSRGRNADTGWTNNYGFSGGASNSTKGWKYTNIPTWEEREEFNTVINDYFDAQNITCRITSGPFLVRCADHGANPVDHYESYEGWAIRKSGKAPWSFSGDVDISRIVKVSERMEFKAKELTRERNRQRRADRKHAESMRNSSRRAYLQIVK